MMRRMYRRADAVVTYGPHVSRYVIRHRKRREGVFAAPQAVERDFSREVRPDEIAAWRAELGIEPQTSIVLFVGRLVREKGIHVLRRAWRRLDAGDRAALCVVGGPAAAAGREPGGVHFVGPLERERLPVAYAAADMLVVPSISTRRFLEPWGLVCNEAMSQGTPVIASAAVGAVAGGLVHHGATGLVVGPGDDRELAAAIGQLLEDEGLRGRLGRLARAKLDDYTYERAADSFGEALRAAGAISEPQSGL
jgi:glycosyltransferase involved in cell wall biosynthesis